MYPGQSRSYCGVGKGLKTCAPPTITQDTCCFVGRLRTFGWRKVPLFPHSFRECTIFWINLSGLERRSLTRNLWSTWCPHYLSPTSRWWAQSPTATRCLLSLEFISLIHKEEIGREVRTPKHEGEILMVQATPKGFQPQSFRHSGGQNNHRGPIRKVGVYHSCGGWRSLHAHMWKTYYKIPTSRL